MSAEQSVGHLFSEIQGVLKEFLSFSIEKGKSIEGDSSEFIKHTAEKIENLVEAAGTNVVEASHSLQLDHLGELAKRMHSQVEHDKSLESFWEDMAQEIPDFIEWTENVLKESGEVLAETAEMLGEVATEVAGEIALEATDIAAAIVTEL